MFCVWQSRCVLVTARISQLPCCIASVAALLAVSGQEHMVGRVQLDVHVRTESAVGVCSCPWCECTSSMGHVAGSFLVLLHQLALLCLLHCSNMLQA